jgi:hypothetical protein
MSSGNEIYHSLANKLGSDRAASEALKEYGIPGIKYRDERSRELNEQHGGVMYEGKNVTGPREYPEIKYSGDNAWIFQKDLEPALNMLHKYGSADKAIAAVEKTRQSYQKIIERGGTGTMGDPGTAVSLAGRMVDQADDTIGGINSLRDKISFAPPKQPTRNFVVFDPKDMKITARNGVELEAVHHNPFE